jgi:hypothetical protein
MENTEPAGLTYQGKPRNWGFRLSAADAIVIALTILGTYLGWRQVGSFVLVLPFVVGHFFLFCNVFRIRRQLELIWGAVFLLLCLAALLLRQFDIYWVTGLQLGTTVFLLFMEIRNPHYHGILARKLNPRLDDYLQDRID